MKNQFTISSAYQWTKKGEYINHSEIALKALANMIKNRFSNTLNGRHNYNINYRRLRSSAGKTILDSIIKRIEDSQVVIIDLTQNNFNVFLEAGISLAFCRKLEFFSVYFIKEKINEESQIQEGIPSDLQGYFITEYKVDNNNNVTFLDNGSLRMSIESDVKDYFNAREEYFETIDEINVE